MIHGLLPRRRSFRFIAVTLILACTTMLAQAGAWTPQKGKIYLKLAANRFQSSANYNIDGDRFDPFADFDDRYSRFEDRNISLYVEYGVTDRFALIGNLIYKDISQRTKLPNLEVGTDNNGFADVDLGFRYRLTNGANVVSVGFLAKLPYFYDDDDNFFQLGNGEEEFEGRLLYGRSLGRGFYAGLEAAWRFKSGDPSDDYRYLGELGYSYKRFFTRSKLEGIYSADSFETSSRFGNPLLEPRYDLTTLIVTAGFQLTQRIYLEYSYSETLAGKNTADGANNQIGISFDL